MSEVLLYTTDGVSLAKLSFSYTHLRVPALTATTLPHQPTRHMTSILPLPQPNVNTQDLSRPAGGAS
jgi:hypothetical protein